MFVVILVRLTGGIAMFKIESTSNEPNLSLNSRIVGSSYLRPEHLDFAYFKFSDSLKGYTIMKRLIAKPFDTLKCINGNYFVNSKNIDSNLNLRFGYKLNSSDYKKYVSSKLSEPEAFSYDNGLNYIVFLDDSFIREIPTNLTRLSSENQSRDRLSNDIFLNHNDWTVNNFGPVVLPENKYFFSGDNRDNSFDSRHRGFVNREDIKGSLLFQF